ncbi:MAG: EamA/RhaT family transporter [Deltaproteobacteria bacterium]|nr:EamA/RhaT family transporter [Deltaproteobacteria bacterium]
MNQIIKSHIAIIGANTIWGLNYVVAKGIMPDFLLPQAVVFLRISGTLVLVWMLDFFLPSEKVEKKDLFKMAVCSIFGVVVNQILFFEGLHRTTPISASIIATSIPIYILIFSHFILKETITGGKVFGIMLGVTGALMIILSAGSGDFRLHTLLGNVMIFTNNACWALYLVLLKPLMEKYTPLTIMKWTFLFGLIIISPFSLRTAVSSSFAQIPLDIWMSVLFVVFITSGFAYCLVNYSLKTVSPNVNGIYIYLQPLVASIVAVIFRNDTFTVIDLVAAVLIMSGVYFVSRRPERKTL